VNERHASLVKHETLNKPTFNRNRYFYEEILFRTVNVCYCMILVDEAGFLKMMRSIINILGSQYRMNTPETSVISY